MGWTVGIDLAAWRPVSQNDGSLDAPLNCAQGNLAAVGEYLTGIKKTGAEVRAEGWPTSNSITDFPGMQSYGASWMATPLKDYHAPSPSALANRLWQTLYWGRPAMFLMTLDGNQYHWATALSMTGGSSGYPFDSLVWNNSWDGTVRTSTYPQWAATLKRYQGDGQYLALSVDRARSIVNDARMGP